jgi:hypothetical protein
MSTEQHTEPGHGDSPAAWTAVILMLVGLSVGTVGFFLDYTYDTDWSWLLWTGVVIFVVGAIVGFVMKRLGYGVDGPKTLKSHQ